MCHIWKLGELYFLLIGFYFMGPYSVIIFKGSHCLVASFAQNSVGGAGWKEEQSYQLTGTC